jgi:pimeloyl-ACP methyl ester carboxylesterase
MAGVSVNSEQLASSIRRDCPPYHSEGTGPLLIHVCGIDGTGKLFFKQTPNLSPSFQVVTFRSRDDAEFTYDDLTADVAGIIRDVGARRATIVGESFGGTVALNFALRYPDLLERLVIVNSFARFRSRTRIRLAMMLSSPAWFSFMTPARLVTNSLGLYLDSVSEADRGTFFDAIRTVGHEGYRQRLRLVAELDVESRLSQIRTPTLFIAAERDLVVSSVREARAMASRMPNARVRVLKGCGHACLLGEQVRLNEILAEWSAQTCSSS